jgi:small GTP-binding protein
MSESKIKRKAIKIAMLGDSQVGKTAICNSFMNIDFSDTTLSTIGTEKLECQMKIKNGEEIKVIIWDTAGQERFRSISLKTIKTVQGVIVVFDLMNKKSFENVVNWLNQINDNFQNISIILFGNKCDVDEEKWMVTREEAQKFADANKLKYFETSAKIKKNIQEGFENIVNTAYEKFEGSKGIKLGDVNKQEDNGCCSGKKKRKSKKTNN